MVEISLNASSQMDGIAKEWALLLVVPIIEISQLWNPFSKQIGNPFTTY